MADEISTVIKAEMDGVTIAIKASVKAAPVFLDALPPPGVALEENVTNIYAAVEGSKEV